MCHEQNECSIGDLALCAGGKTASLKAVGLTAIMAKAGLFIPTAHQPPEHNTNSIYRPEHSKQQQQQEQQQQQDQQQQKSQHPDPQQSSQQQQQGLPHPDVQLSDKQQQGSHHPDAQQSDKQQEQQQQQQDSQKPDAQLSDKQQQQQPPRMVFFDRVLADVGDSQNLQQSLSTFSGHIRRVRSILQEATPNSLVLLDEVSMPLLVSCPSVCLLPVLLLLLFSGSDRWISASCS